MTSILLVISSRYISPLLLVLSLVALYRGHNLPGGGFIGGLIAAASVLLLALAEGWDKTEKRMPIPLMWLIPVGLTIALASALLGMLSGGTFFQGLWLPFFELPLLGKVKLGTPLLFDVGVYVVVIGFTLMCARALAGEREEDA